MKIAFVNTAYQLGGAETVVRQLHTACLEHGHESILYLADGKTYPPGDDVRPLYPRVLSRLAHSRFRQLSQGLFPRHEWTDRSFRKLVDRDYDLVHLHNFHGQYATIESLAYLSRNKKTIWTLHGSWAFTGGCDQMISGCRRYLDACGECPQLGIWPVGTTDDTAEQLLLKNRLLSDVPLTVVVPSQHMSKAVRQSRVGKNWDIRHIPNGVNHNQFTHERKRNADFRQSLGIEADTIVILVVNRNFRDPFKGGGTVRDALNMMHSESVTVVAAGENSEWLKESLKPGIRVISLGYVSSQEKLRELYEAADIFLFASPHENFPCVILEAMASQCCVVSTPTAGVVEQVEDMSSGVLSTEIAGHSLGTALNAVLSNTDKIVLYGRSAREMVIREFSEETVIARYLDLYASCLPAKL